MKRLFAMVISIVFALSLAATASAATAATPQPIRVTLNGQQIPFVVNPVIINSKTYVEFRTLFGKFGYQVDYDAKTRTVKAASSAQSIQMSLGGGVAVVDSNDAHSTINSTGELKIVNNHTMVGVRFIATLSGENVDWNGKTRTVTITNKGPSATEQAAIYGLFDKVLDAEATGDSQALAALFAQDTKIGMQQIMPDWTKVKTQTTYLSKSIVSYSANAAVVQISDQTVKVSGAFFPNNQSVTQYTLHKDASGQWKIYDIKLLDMKLINTDKLFDQEVTVPDEDKTGIVQVVGDQITASNEENMDKYLATMTTKDDAELQQVKEAIQQQFDAYDATSTLEKAAVVDYNGSDQATVLISMVVDLKVNGASVGKARVILTNGVEKKDGKWLLNTTTEVLSNEAL